MKRFIVKSKQIPPRVPLKRPLRVAPSVYMDKIHALINILYSVREKLELRIVMPRGGYSKTYSAYRAQ